LFATGNGNHDINYYNCTDISPFSGTSFYRLKMINGDGRFRYSPVKMIRLDKGFDKITVSPVPANDRASLIVRTYSDGELSLQVSDISGKIVYNRVVSIRKGENVIDLPFVQQAGDGMYFINARLNGKQETAKLLVIKK